MIRLEPKGGRPDPIRYGSRAKFYHKRFGQWSVRRSIRNSQANARLFMREEMPAEKQAALAEIQTDREKFAVIGCEIYAMLLDGLAESVVFKKNFIEGKLKTPITGRNWRTVQKLGEL